MKAIYFEKLRLCGYVDRVQPCYTSAPACVSPSADWLAPYHGSDNVNNSLLWVVMH